MSQRTIVLVLILAVAILGVALWFKQTMQPAQPQATAPEATGETPGGEAPGMPPQGMPPQGMPPQGAPQGMGEPAGEAMDLGVAWKVPAGWQPQGERPMRVATYTVPKAAGDPEDGECAVFYFGPNQGGGVDDNIDRWVGQFADPDKPVRSQQTVAGMAVARVSVDGTYLAPAGMNMAPTGEKKNYRLLGGIVSGPNGNVFFKFTGPRKTVEQASKAFDGMLASLKQQ
jgi:hypothetical protein